MQLTATEFRKHLFETLEAALRGEPVELTYKGEKLSLIPEKQTYTKLSRLKPNDYLIGTDEDYRRSKQQLLEEMQQAWEEDWKEL